MPLSSRRGSSIALVVRSESRAAVGARLSSRTTPPARTSRDSSADDTLDDTSRSEEYTSELQSLAYLVCRLLLEKKKRQPGSTRSHLKQRDLLPVSTRRLHCARQILRHTIIQLHLPALDHVLKQQARERLSSRAD